MTTTETAKNGVKVRTVEEPGEDVTAKVTIPKSVGEAVVTIPADVDYGMVAVDAATGEVVKLSVPHQGRHDRQAGRLRRPGAGGP